MTGMILNSNGTGIVATGSTLLTISPYASVANLPVTASENDIAVITTNEITNWCIRAEAPANPSEGALWIITRDGGYAWFNIGEATAPIIVYPACIYQYVNGTWLYKDSYIWQNNQWMQIVYYLYKRGEEYSPITNDWKIVNGSNGTGVKNENNIYLGYKSSSGRTSSLYTTGRIDFTPFRTMYIRYMISAVTNQLNFGVASANTTSNTVPDIVNQTISGSTNTERITMVDVSEVDGQYYVGAYANITNVYIYEIWLE